MQTKLLALLIIPIISFSTFQAVYAPPIANSIGIISLTLNNAYCSSGFYGQLLGTCSTDVSEMPIGFEIPLPSSGHLQNLYVVMSDYDNSNYQVYINNNPTNLKCTMGTTLDCSDTTHSIHVNAGDHLMIRANNPDVEKCTATVSIILTT